MYTKFIRCISILSFIPFIFISAELFADEIAEKNNKIVVENETAGPLNTIKGEIAVDGKVEFEVPASLRETWVDVYKPPHTSWDCRLWIKNEGGKISVQAPPATRCNDTFKDPPSYSVSGDTATFIIKDIK